MRLATLAAVAARYARRDSGSLRSPHNRRNADLLPPCYHLDEERSISTLGFT